MPPRQSDRANVRPLTLIHALLGITLTAALLFAASCKKSPTVPTAQENGLPLGHYPPNTEQELYPEFVRFVEGGKYEGTLDTAVATYEGENGEKVDLIGAVHIADEDYYERLEELFAGYDSLLYELVMPEDAEPPQPGVERDSAGGGLNVLGLLQRGMGEGLQLDYQVDGIDYSKPNFVHADLTAEAFSKLSKERGQSMPQLMLEAVFRQVTNTLKGEAGGTDPLLQFKMLGAMFSKNRAQRMKFLFARELANAIDLLGETDLDGEESVILIARNKKAVEVLRERLATGEKHIGIFYGAAHLADLEERIFDEIGLKRTGVRWEQAWLVK
jgi:hypothetical protein